MLDLPDPFSPVMALKNGSNPGTTVLVAYDLNPSKVTSLMYIASLFGLLTPQMATIDRNPRRASASLPPLTDPELESTKWFEFCYFRFFSISNFNQLQGGKLPVVFMGFPKNVRIFPKKTCVLANDFFSKIDVLQNIFVFVNLVARAHLGFSRRTFFMRECL